MGTLSIAASELACVRGERLVFSGLTFSLSSGEAAEIVGPNGSGKSSLLRLVAGLLEPADGTLEVRTEGYDGERQALVHFVAHLDGLKPTMSARETLVFYAGLFGQKPPSEELFARVGLERQRDLPVQFLSAGQRRRLALARLLVARRPVWLLDEPFASLDSVGRGLVASLIAAHLASGGIAMAATHDAIIAGARRIALGASA